MLSYYLPHKLFYYIVDFIPPKEQSGNRISSGAVVGIVVAAVCFVSMILGTLWWKGCLRHKETMEQGMSLRVQFEPLQISSIDTYSNQCFMQISRV